MNKVAILGSGDLGVQLYTYLTDCEVDVVGFLDDTKEVGTYQNLPNDVIGNTATILDLFENRVFQSVIIALGYKHLKIKSEISLWLSQNHIPQFTFIHPSSFVHPSSIIEDGVVIYPNCTIDQRVTLRKNALLNLGVIVSHDSVIGKSTFIAPGALVSGFCDIGAECFLGSRCVVIDNIKVSESTVIGAGSLVLKNIGNTGVYFGNPAKFQRR